MSERCQSTTHRVGLTPHQCNLAWGHVGPHASTSGLWTWINAVQPCGHLESCIRASNPQAAYDTTNWCGACAAAPEDHGDDPALDFQPWDEEEG